MWTVTAFFLAGLMTVVSCVAVSAFSKRPAADWNYYHFDGHGFVAGHPPAGGAAIAVQDGGMPAVARKGAKAGTVALSPGNGAIAGVCFMQSSGGKLGPGQGFVTRAGIVVAVYSGETVLLHTQTDESGYFLAVLPAGVYRISSGSFATDATVREGQTTLAVVKTGKRMVD